MRQPCSSEEIGMMRCLLRCPGSCVDFLCLSVCLAAGKKFSGWVFRAARCAVFYPIIHKKR